MKKDSRIVFFDIDGTIFELDKGTPDSTREALEHLKINGHIPVVCTGRSIARVFPDILNRVLQKYLSLPDKDHFIQNIFYI